MSASSLASLSFTHVHYNSSDHVSFACAWLALVPQALLVAYITLMWATREAEIMLMFSGQVGCEALNLGLKRWIKEERPAEMYGKGYGMPSSHAQFVSYFAMSLTLFLLFRHTPSKQVTPSHTPLSLKVRIGVSALSLAGAAMVSWSRIYLNYHTPKQVLAGVLAGTASACLWFLATSMLRKTGILSSALDLPAARIFRLRDLVVEEDLSQAGWEKWEARSLQARPIKLSKNKVS